MDKVKNIINVNKTINNLLETTVALVTKAKIDVTETVNLFNSLVEMISTLQTNISALKKIGKSAYETARQRYINASIVFNVTSPLETHLSNSSSIAEVLYYLVFILSSPSLKN